MNRMLLLVGLGMAALSGGSMILVYLCTAEDPTAAPSLLPPPVAAAAGAAAPAPPRATAPAAVPPAASAGWSAGDPLAMARARREERSRSPVPPADRVTRSALRKALLAPLLQSRLERCVPRDVGSGSGIALAPRGAAAVLVLDLEPLGGQGSQLRIGDVQVRAWGGASEQAVSCARDVLRGLVVAAPAASPIGRSRMEFPLNPRSQALTAAR